MGTIRDRNGMDLVAIQRTLKSLLQHHSSKASILWCSAFFIVQLSHPYMTTGKTIALTRWTFDVRCESKKKETIHKIIKQPTKCENIFVNHISDGVNTLLPGGFLQKLMPAAVICLPSIIR